MLIYQCIRILASTSNIKIFEMTMTLFNLFYDHDFVEMHYVLPSKQCCLICSCSALQYSLVKW